jgi:hypothetical protein
MIRWRPILRWSALVIAGNCLILPLLAEEVTDTIAPATSLSTPAGLLPFPQRVSPVDFFRRLLAMTPRERNDSLTNRSPEIRGRILAKIHEYQSLGPDERELRLQATELRWYLLPLMQDASTNHEARLTQVPDGIRDLVKSRLRQWEILPPQIQQEFLQNQRALRYFAEINVTNRFATDETGHDASQEDQTRWNSLSDAQRQAMTAQFSEFFDLNPREKQKTLNTLSETERQQMESTLQSYDKLPPLQRRECLRAFTQFAGMSNGERAEFLKNAEHWSQLSPKERQAWRDLVAQVPQWPPLPLENLMPPKPVHISPRPHSALATNLN